MHADDILVEAEALARLPGIRHGFFTRQGGVSAGIYAALNGGLGSRDGPAAVGENRARMARALGVPAAHLLTAYQVHSPDVVVVDAPWAAEARPRADAIVTAVPGIAAGVSTADCGPVLFAEPQARVVAAAHAGWRGALGGVIEATVATMERLGAARARIVAALGPMIRQRNYEVGADMRGRVIDEDDDSDRFFAAGARAGHWQFDLAGYIAARLTRAGVGAVSDLGLCTYAEPERFFSYRRSVHRGEADYGRHVNAIALVD